MVNRPLRIVCIAGARPNFMKIAPILRALDASSKFDGIVVHTGQHYDKAMSEVFFQQLGIPAPQINLDVGSSSHGVQTGRIMIAFEERFDEIAPDAVLVVGDVNSTIACALVAVKRHIPVIHVEAGLRSGDRRMPEEINRILTDQISDLLFLTEESARENLAREGVDDAKIHFTGNTMIDTLAYMLPRVESSTAVTDLGLNPGEYGVLTFHRPSNVDDPARLSELVEFLVESSERVPFVFPVHPRTRQRLENAGLWTRLDALESILLTGPQPYIDFMALVRGSRFVLTDSGGIQEETTWLGVPCLTQRTTTERPVTLTQGTNVLLGDDFDRTRMALDELLAGRHPQGERPPLWDGRCAERIVEILERSLG